MKYILGQPIPNWAGEETYNCFVASFQMAASVQSTVPTLFGGFIGPVDARAQRDVDPGEWARVYMNFIHQGIPLEDLLELHNIHSNADLVQLAQQDGFEGQVVFSLQMEDLANYPAELDLQYEGVRHCVFGMLDAGGDRLNIMESSVDIGERILCVPVALDEPPLLHTPSTVGVYQVNRFLQQFSREESEYVAARKKEYIMLAADRANENLKIGNQYTDCISKTDLLRHVHWGGNIALYKLHYLALSDLAFWSDFDTSALHALNAKCRKHSLTIKAMMLRRVTLLRLGKSVDAVDQRITDQGLQLDSLLTEFYHTIWGIVADG